MSLSTVIDIEDLVASSSTTSTSSQGNGAHSLSNDEHDGVHRSAQFYNVIVIGAGVIGCAIARELSQYNIRVAVIEAQDDVSQGASKANSGIIHGGYAARHGTLKAQLVVEGNRRFTKLDEELNFGVKRIGSLVLAHNAEDEETIQRLLENGKKNGAVGIRLLNAEETRRIEPNVASTVVGSLLCETAGITSPYEYCCALAENACDNGVDFVLNSRVQDIQRIDEQLFSTTNPRFVVQTTAKAYECTWIVNASGINADRIAQMCGACTDWRIEPRKGEYILLDRSQGSLVNHVVFPPPSSISKGCLVSPTLWGQLLLGPTARDLNDPEQAKLSNNDVAKLIIHSAKQSVEHLHIDHAITSFAGLRATSSRHDWVIEQAPMVPGFINAAGIDSPGLTASPAVAQIIVDIMLGAGCVLEAKSNFIAYRKAIAVHKDGDFRGKVGHSVPEKNIVCRCERVTEAEIVSCCHRSLHIASTDAVKKRTRAGMGRCQGNFCESRVAALIARECHVAVESVGRRGHGSSILPHRRLTPEDRELLAKL